MRKWLALILFFSGSSFAQEDSSNTEYAVQIFEQMNYRNGFENYYGFIRNKDIHGNIRPSLVTVDSSRQGGKMHFESFQEKKEGKHTYLSIYPIMDAMIGTEIHTDASLLINGGAGLGLDLSTKKFVLTGRVMPTYTTGGYLGDSISQRYNSTFGTNRALLSNLFYRSTVLASFKANKFFTLTGGMGKNFFGEGYRSLLLSDNAGAYPFFRIETAFAGIKYVNLYSFMRDNSSDPFNYGEDILKFSSSHYLSWNITKDINVSIFETVVFQPRDSSLNRGFDLNYINPIVFYRPVEYGLGSADNVIMGLSSSFKLDEHNIFYGQFVLDEFLLAQIRARERWWANKYGWQLGFKSDRFFADDLYFQIECNGVRPYTYSHFRSQHAYGHLNAPLAHPLGANFMELVNITSYKHKKHRFTNKMTFASYGVDPIDTVSYGQDIFASYNLRPGEFQQLLFQGVRTNTFNESFIYEYALLPKIGLYLTASYRWRMVYQPAGIRNFHSFQVGLRSRMWNTYSDL